MLITVRELCCNTARWSGRNSICTYCSSPATPKPCPLTDAIRLRASDRCWSCHRDRDAPENHEWGPHQVEKGSTDLGKFFKVSWDEKGVSIWGLGIEDFPSTYASSCSPN